MRGLHRDWWLLAAVAGVAFAMRLVPVLRGGGLYGLVGYDGSVYYTAAAGLAHGLLPYQDFLLLHPPGIAVVLLPFAVLGRLIDDPDAMAVARVAWMALGAVNAVLVSRILRPFGRVAAFAGGGFYAVFLPAIKVEHSTTLEGVASVGILGALLLVTRSQRGVAVTDRTFVLAGLLIGASTSVKIWGVVVLAALVAWCLVTLDRRLAGMLTLGAGASLVAICLPFFLAAPTSMWQMVVRDQLGRARVEVSLVDRLADLAGVSAIGVLPVGVLLGLMGLASAAGLVLAVANAVGRLAVLLLLVTVLLLLVTPSWSVDYASLAAGPLALVVGTATGSLIRRLHNPPVRAATSALIMAGLGAYGAETMVTSTFGRPFPGAALRTALAPTPGCVTTDDPTALVQTGALQRNFARGCPLVADLGGYSYDLRPGADLQVGRARNQQWQQHALDYLGSGGAAMIVRFRTSTGFSAATKAEIGRWPVIGAAGAYEVRQPPGDAGSVWRPR